MERHTCQRHPGLRRSQPVSAAACGVSHSDIDAVHEPVESHGCHQAGILRVEGNAGSLAPMLAEVVMAIGGGGRVGEKTRVYSIDLERRQRMSHYYTLPGKIT